MPVLDKFPVTSWKRGTIVLFCYFLIREEDMKGH